ncbi:OmpP1/FadL family transporter [Cognatazoarcus halotolerans]|uniref:OmpP1/FadL family transporter n=1 Tax=Cognatazoarcus halotolerans TaxID=2686016 RepID=UPI00135BF15E|nr:outer membrane protein transport protein [Cognatazoarcus halotolerans]MCB1901655.1 outer membrane protein transport protein [Rhodocyclaceae bacterium]MCP5310812.1 outer membrane protein transport protein [Zoogloeaceae bacterium]
MKTRLIAQLVTVALAALGSGSASAAGFQLLEQNASGIGNAYAGSAAVAENASTIYFNPAGMTQLQDREYSIGIDFVRPTFKFKDRGSISGPLTGNGDDAGSWAIIPNGYLSWALSKDLYVGVGLGAPFGLVTEYDDPWIGAAQAIKFDITTYNINPSIAYRINDKVSVGFGVNWQRMDAEYVRAAAIVNPALAATRATLDVSNDAWGWNVGALFTLSPSMRIGVSYRSAIKHELDGDLKISGPAKDGDPIGGTLSNGAASVDVELPDVFVLSVVQQLDRRWEMLGDISWTGWSKIDQLDIVRRSGPSINQTVQTLDADFRDTWRIALGANYQLNDAWKLKFGIAYDQTPVKGPATRLVSLPDSNRTWFTFGGQWKADKASTLDLGVAYLNVSESKINNNQVRELRGTVTGVYDARVWILGAQYSRAF